MVDVLEIERLDRDGVPSRLVRIAFRGDVYAVTVVQQPDGDWEPVDVAPRPETVTDDALLRVEAVAAVRD